MKRTITILVIGLLMVAGTQSWAQDQGQIRVGASLAIGTKAGINDTGGEKIGMGLNFGGDYFVIDKLSIAPSYTFFFKSTTRILDSGFEYDLRVSSFNIDGKYYFLTEGINVYGLFGVSFARVKSSFGFLGIPVSANETGINIGGGVDYMLSNKLYLNGQVKYNTPLEQLVISVGVGYVIK